MFTGLLIAGLCLAGAVSFTIGANDVANSIATSVWAGTLTHKQATVLAGIFEFLGALLMGSRVSDTIRKGIVDVSQFVGSPVELALGMLSALTATGLWLLVATFVAMPVSTTHSILGAVVGFAITSRGISGVSWGKVGLIVLSWIISPLFAAAFTSGLFLATRRWVLSRSDSAVRALATLPYFLGLTLAVNTFFVVYKGTPALGLKDTPLLLGIGASIVVGVITGAIGLAFRGLLSRVLARRMAKSSRASPAPSTPSPVASPDKADAEAAPSELKEIPVTVASAKGDVTPTLPTPTAATIPQTGKVTGEEVTAALAHHDHSKVYDDDAEEVFKLAQVVTACFAAFSHGSNDLANAIGPAAAILTIYMSNGEVTDESPVPAWLLALGGLGIVIGLFCFGKRVMKTIGRDLAMVSPSRGFAIELGAALTVVVASRLGLPVSTSHSQVGSVVGCGVVDGRKAVDWRLFHKIAWAWLFTLPVTGLVTAGIYAILAAIFT